jgi:predicted transposase YdaD
LYELGYKRSDVLNLFKFLDWAMILPEGLKRAFWEELKAYEEERKMPYVTSVEEIGMEKATKTIALNMLKDNLPLEQIARLTGLTIAQLKKLQAEAK